MTSFTQTVDLMEINFRNPATCKRAVLLLGKPGCGKSSTAYELADRLDVEHSNVHVTHPPRQNPVDYMGLPNLTEDNQMRWAEPELLHKLSTGRHILMVEEVAQCGPMMQNTIAGLCLDRKTNSVALSDEVFIILTGNNVEDRAGAKPIMTHLGNRVMVLNVEYGIKDFEPYAMRQAHLDPVGLAFLIKSPNKLFDFDSARLQNATPRSWEYALSMDYNNTPAHLRAAALDGILPAGIVSEYMAFRDVADRLPDPREIRAHPTTAPVPREVDVLYVATAGLIIETDDVPAFEELMPYINRLPQDFQTLYVHTTQARVKGINQSSEYLHWITNNAAAFGAAK